MKTSKEMFYFGYEGNYIPISKTLDLRFVILTRARKSEDGTYSTTPAKYVFKGHDPILDEEWGIKTVLANLGSVADGMLQVPGLGGKEPYMYLIRKEDVIKWPQLFGINTPDVCTIELKDTVAVTQPEIRLVDYAKFIKKNINIFTEDELKHIYRGEEIADVFADDDKRFELKDIAYVAVKKFYNHAADSLVIKCRGKSLCDATGHVMRYSDCERVLNHPALNLVFTGEDFDRAFVNWNMVDEETFGRAANVVKDWYPYGSSAIEGDRIRRIPIRLPNGRVHIMEEAVTIPDDELKECARLHVPIHPSRMLMMCAADVADTVTHNMEAKYPAGTLIKLRRASENSTTTMQIPIRYEILLKKYQEAGVRLGQISGYEAHVNLDAIDWDHTRGYWRNLSSWESENRRPILFDGILQNRLELNNKSHVENLMARESIPDELPTLDQNGKLYPPTNSSSIRSQFVASDIAMLRVSDKFVTIILKSGLLSKDMIPIDAPLHKLLLGWDQFQWIRAEGYIVPKYRNLNSPNNVELYINARCLDLEKTKWMASRTLDSLLYFKGDWYYPEVCVSSKQLTKIEEEYDKCE